MSVLRQFIPLKLKTRSRKSYWFLWLLLFQNVGAGTYFIWTGFYIQIDKYIKKVYYKQIDNYIFYTKIIYSYWLTKYTIHIIINRSINTMKHTVQKLFLLYYNTTKQNSFSSITFDGDLAVTVWSLLLNACRTVTELHIGSVVTVLPSVRNGDCTDTV